MTLLEEKKSKRKIQQKTVTILPCDGSRLVTGGDDSRLVSGGEVVMGRRSTLWPEMDEPGGLRGR